MERNEDAILQQVEIIEDGYTFKLFHRSKNIYKCVNCNSQLNMSTDTKTGHSSKCRNKKSRSSKILESDVPLQSEVVEIIKIREWRNKLSKGFKKGLTDYTNNHSKILSRLERNEAMEYVDPEKIFFNFVLNGQKYFVKGLKKNRNFRFSLVYEEISRAEKYIHPNLISIW